MGYGYGTSKVQGTKTKTKSTLHYTLHSLQADTKHLYMRDNIQNLSYKIHKIQSLYSE